MPGAIAVKQGAKKTGIHIKYYIFRKIQHHFPYFFFFSAFSDFLLVKNAFM